MGKVATSSADTVCLLQASVLILNHGIIYIFASVKMDITPKKWANIVVLNEQTSMTVKDIASVVGGGKLSGSRICCAYKDSGSLSPKRKGKCERKQKNHSSY
jgi:hypothetical protein